jgi:hypothetical protein
MTETQKQELERAIAREVVFGFLSAADIVERIYGQFSEEYEIDTFWLETMCDDRMKKHGQLSVKWTHPTHFDRLSKAFDLLIREDIICLLVKTLSPIVLKRWRN